MPDIHASTGKAITGLVLALMAMGVSACADPPPPAGPPVIMPGAPGDQPRTATSAELDEIAKGLRPTKADLEYLRMMIPHHAQALEMTALAPDRAAHPSVRALAERIGGSQRPEIDAMRGWLANKGAPPEGHGGHGQHGNHTTMPGMATPKQLADLREARGTAFDRRFLELMIAHHQGAVVMAGDLLAQGLDAEVHAMAQDVLVTQQDEIATMRRLLGEIA